MLRNRMVAINIYYNRLHYQARYCTVCDTLFNRSNNQHRRVINELFRSCFLATPITQVKDMFKKTRWILTLLYLGSIGGTITMAILLPEGLRGLVILMLVIQIICYYLYTLSYIPYGRTIIKKCCECILF